MTTGTRSSEPLGRSSRRSSTIPRLSHVYFDISWDEVAKYAIATPETIERGPLPCSTAIPDRFLFGTDNVAPADQATQLRVFNMWDPVWAQLTPEAQPADPQGQLRAPVRCGAREGARVGEGEHQGHEELSTPDMQGCTRVSASPRASARTAKSRRQDVTIQKLAGAILVGVPLLAHGQTTPYDLQAMTNRQIELEKQVHEQDARIRELERLLKERLGTDGAGAAPAVPAAQDVATPAVQQPAAPAAAATEATLSRGESPAGQTAATAEAPDYIGNLGFKIYEGDKGQIYMRLMAYARYLNQSGIDPTYTDSFGTVRTIDRREDFQLNKFFLPFSGWFLDPKFRYYLYVWSTNTAQGDPAQVVGAGNISYVMNSFATIGLGITSLPGVRSTEGQFPYWNGVDDRLMADEFFRPSYTTGMWLKGQFAPGVNYMAMLGNNMSTLGVSASQLDDTVDTWSVMLNWLPTTKEYGPLGAFGDFENHQELATRLGAHFTHSTEDRQQQPGTDSIENTQIRLTDGNVIFTPSLFGPGITVEKVQYQMASFDAGLKYKGYALEGEYYRRWLSDFVGPGVAAIDDITDEGYQLWASAMVLPSRLQAYVGLSEIFGDDFGDASELRFGFNYFPMAMRGLRLNGEWMILDNAPLGYTAFPYPVGANGDVIHLNFEYNF